MAPSILRGRLRTVTYLYDDPQHPGRLSGHVESQEWTDDDRALMLALAQYESTLCPGCGVAKDVAWHSHAEGWFDHTGWVCHSCSAIKGHEVAFRNAFLDEALTPEKLAAWPPFEFGVTITEPSQTETE